MRVISRKIRGINAIGRPPECVKSIVSVDGHIVPAEKALISVFDSAYLYGVGIFETLKVVQGTPLFLRLHDERLRRNARRIGLKMPLTAGLLQRRIGDLLKKASLTEATLRVVLSADPEGRPRLVIIAKPYTPYPRRCYRDGARIVIAKTVKADSPGMAAIKTTSYLTKMLARREAKQRGADEALLVNERGHITEGASSNVFVVKRNHLITPPLPAGLLPGTRRKVVLAIAKRLKISVHERPLLPKDLTQADEVFITSSLKGIMPVGWVEGRGLRGTPGPMTGRMVNLFDGIVQRNCHYQCT